MRLTSQFRLTASLLAVLLPSQMAMSAAPPPRRATARLGTTQPGPPGALNTGDVSLATGDLTLSTELVNLPGRNGMAVSVSAAYSSNIQKMVDNWNLDAPVGVVGLGWSLPVNAVLRSANGTGPEQDDAYFLVDNGDMNQLLPNGIDAAGKIYQLAKHQFWRVRYQESTQEWTVIKEDGMKYVYGGSAGHAIEWGVRWRFTSGTSTSSTWIGSSTRVTGQEQFPVAWNLARQQNTWGETVTLEYKPVEQSVGTMGSNRKKYTQENHIQRITGAFGDSAVFNYAQKSTGEFQDPHTFTGSTATVRRVTGTVGASRNWDTTSPPDIYGKATITGAGGFSYQYDIPEVTDQYFIHFSVELPANAPETVDVALEFKDHDSLNANDLMFQHTFTSQTCNAAAQTLSQTDMDKSKDNNTATVQESFICAQLASEPDAYQERFETLYLDSVDLFSADGTKTGTVDLDNTTLLGKDQMQKRLLTGVRHMDAEGVEESPSEKYSYYNESDGVSVTASGNANAFKHGAYYGALKSQTAVTGAVTTYRYAQNTIASALRSHQVNPPDANWEKPHVYFGPDYVVSTWRGKNANVDRVHLTVLEWNGGWSVTSLGSFPLPSVSELLVTVQQEFFAVALSKQTAPVQVFRKDRLVTGRWTTYAPAMSTTGTPLHLAGGDKFVALLDEWAGIVYRWTWDGWRWNAQSNLDLRSSTSALAPKYAMSAYENVLMAVVTDLDAANKPLQVKATLATLDPSLLWIMAYDSKAYTMPAVHPFYPVSVDSLRLAEGNGFFTLQVGRQADGCNGGQYCYDSVSSVYRWSQDSTQLMTHVLAPPVLNSKPSNDEKLPLLVSTTSNGIYMSTEGVAYTFRYTGTDWSGHQDPNITPNLVYAPDLVTLSGADGLTHDKSSFLQFDPNVENWKHLDKTISYDTKDVSRLLTVLNVVFLIAGVIMFPLGFVEDIVLEIGVTLLDMALTAGQIVSDVMIRNFMASDPEAGSTAFNYIATKNQVFHNNPDESWSLVGSLVTPESDLIGHQAAVANGYVNYMAKSGGNTRNFTRMLQNGQFFNAPVSIDSGSAATLKTVNTDAADTQPLTSATTFLAYPITANTFADAPYFMVYEVENGGMTGAIQDIAVTSVTVDDGYQSTTMHYEYDTATADHDSQGLTAYYNKVTSIPGGTRDTPSKDNGFTETFFLNDHVFTDGTGAAALPPHAHDDTIRYCDKPGDPASCHSRTKDRLNMVRGLPYFMQVCGHVGGGCGEVSSQSTRYVIQELQTPGLQQPTSYLRPVRTTVKSKNGTAAHSLTSDVETAYNANGLTASTTSSRLTADGTRLTVVDETRYALDVYQDPTVHQGLVNQNLLNPVAESVRKAVSYTHLTLPTNREV